MTPKEKAEELLEKFYGLPTGNTNRCVDWLTATESALIAVDEITNECLNWTGGESIKYDIERFEYWAEVKTEIKKL